MKKLLLLFVAMLSLNTFAQEKIDEGVITMKMVMDTDNEQAKAQFAMLGEIPLTVYFKGKKSRTEQKSPMIGNNTNIIDSESKKMLLLLDNPMAGKKYNEIDIAKMDVKPEDIKVTETGDTKTIAGYVCKGYNLILKKGGIETKSTLYLTDKLIIPNQNTMVSDKLIGFPLLTIQQVNQMGMNMTITLEATSVKAEKVDDSKFDMTVPEGYTKIEKPKAPAIVD